MRAVGADVARDLRELVDRQEDLVVALVLEVEVVARDAGDGLGVEAGEARDAVVLVDDDVAGAQVGEAPQQSATSSRGARRRLAPVDEAVLETLGTAAVSYQIVLTKADELKPGELDKRIAETQQKIAKRAAAFPEIISTSSRSGLGIPELRAGVAKLLSERGAG